MRIKTKIIASSDSDALTYAIDNFVKDKHVIDIKYQSMFVPTRLKDGTLEKATINDRVLIIYEEA